MFFDTASDLVRLLVLAPLLYLWLVLVLRLTGKRTLAQLNAFDLVVSVAFGSTFASAIQSKDISLSEGALGLLVLCLLQLALALLTVRFGAAQNLVTSEPRLLLRDGALLHDALADERVTADLVRQVVRSSGTGALEDIAAVVLETNGTFSVISRPRLGSGSALVEVIPGIPGGGTSNRQKPDA